MSKAEDYIKKSICRCQEGDRPYNEWISVDCAKEATKIAREELIEKVVEWLLKNDSYAKPTEVLVRDLKQAMKDE